MDEIIDLVFGDADEAHREHLLTQSYAQHEALGKFYGDVRDALDAFVEAAIALDMPLPEHREPNMLNRLEETYVKLVDNRGVTCGGNVTLENLHDELTAVYLKAIYRLKRLS